jgi:hypothetical protein
MVGLAGCSLLVCSKVNAVSLLSHVDEGGVIDPGKLMYCGYVCPEDCKFLKGSLENDVALKKEAYDLWKIKERFNVEFDEEKIYVRTRINRKGLFSKTAVSEVVLFPKSWIVAFNALN